MLTQHVQGTRCDHPQLRGVGRKTGKIQNTESLLDLGFEVLIYAQKKPLFGLRKYKLYDRETMSSVILDPEFYIWFSDLPRSLASDQGRAAGLVQAPA